MVPNTDAAREKVKYFMPDSPSQAFQRSSILHLQSSYKTASKVARNAFTSLFFALISWLLRPLVLAALSKHAALAGIPF